MLRSLQIANHKSIRDEQELVLLPSYDKDQPAVPVVAIFGANASGKSTLLDGLLWMRKAVLESFSAWQPGAGVPRVPFRLDAARDKPSSYAVELLLDGVRYLYGFELDDERVLQEWLYNYPRQRRRVVFEREGDTVHLGSSLPEARSREEILSGLTRENTLLLSVAAHSNQREMLPVYQWLRSGLRVADQRPAGTAADLTQRLGAGSARRRATLALIRSADLGIEDVTIDVTLLDEETLGRDEVWFVEKDAETGASRLFPLTDFHPRKNENTERRYLAGSYGAVPVISEAEIRNALGAGDGADDVA